MHRFDAYFLYFLSLGILALVFLGVPKLPHHKVLTPRAPLTFQQRVSHKVVFLDAKGEPEGTCTGTAIGPNALLTGEHCNSEGNKMVRLDLATEKHNILDWEFDGRDHVIYLFDGSPFTNYETVKVSSEAVLAETITFYGNDEGSYPAIPHYGKVKDCEDPSDLDADAEQFCFNAPVYPGDSGSAVYNVRGEIVGLITYRHTAEDGTLSGIGYQLNFSPYVYAYAASFKAEENSAWQRLRQHP